MPKVNPEIKVLLNVMPKEYWQEEILKKLDLRPLDFDDISKEFGFEKDSREYKDLMILVSSLQERHKNLEPKVKAAFVEGVRLYPLYRTDQENELVQRGVLSEEHCFRPFVTAHDLEIEHHRHLISRER